MKKYRTCVSGAYVSIVELKNINVIAALKRNHVNWSTVVHTYCMVCCLELTFHFTFFKPEENSVQTSCQLFLR